MITSNISPYLKYRYPHGSSGGGVVARLQEALLGLDRSTGVFNQSAGRVALTPTPRFGNQAKHRPSLDSVFSPFSGGTTVQGMTNKNVLEGVLRGVPAAHRASAREHFPGIIAEANKRGLSDDQLSYVLATTVHESAAGKFMTELASGKRYEGNRDLGNIHPGDGVRYKGRGYVQLTGRRNYADWSKRLGVDLINNPELASRPDIARQILVEGMKKGTFTGQKLGKFINGQKTEFENARQTVNGMDKAGPIASIARAIGRAFRGTDRNRVAADDSEESKVEAKSESKNRQETSETQGQGRQDQDSEGGRQRDNSGDSDDT